MLTMNKSERMRDFSGFMKEVFVGDHVPLISHKVCHVPEGGEKCYENIIQQRIQSHLQLSVSLSQTLNSSIKNISGHSFNHPAKNWIM